MSPILPARQNYNKGYIKRKQRPGTPLGWSQITWSLVLIACSNQIINSYLAFLDFYVLPQKKLYNSRGTLKYNNSLWGGLFPTIEGFQSTKVDQVSGMLTAYRDPCKFGCFKACRHYCFLWGQKPGYPPSTLGNKWIGSRNQLMGTKGL